LRTSTRTRRESRRHSTRARDDDRGPVEPARMGLTIGASRHSPGFIGRGEQMKNSAGIVEMPASLLPGHHQARYPGAQEPDGRAGSSRAGPSPIESHPPAATAVPLSLKPRELSWRRCKVAVLLDVPPDIHPLLNSLHLSSPLSRCTYLSPQLSLVPSLPSRVFTSRSSPLFACLHLPSHSLPDDGCIEERYVARYEYTCRP
jgi:hypothetical protein